MRTTLVTIALIAAAGIGSAVYAQTTTQPTTPSAPGGTTMPGGTPGGTTMPRTDSPIAKPIAGEAAAKAALEAKGYSGVKQLKRDNAGNWTGKAKKNNAEVAVILDPTGNIREQ